MLFLPVWAVLFTVFGMLDIGSLASYLVYVRQSAMPLNQFTQQVNFLLSALSGAERIFDMMEEPRKSTRERSHSVMWRQITTH